MSKPQISTKEIDLIVKLRQTGHSLSEIKAQVKRSKATLFKYFKDVEISPAYKNILKAKQGGSIARSKMLWATAKERAEKLISIISNKEKLIALSCLYWGEGNKRELNLINSDPFLIKVFLEGLYSIGVTKDMLKVTLRIYEDLNKNEVVKFWSKTLEIPKSQISGIDILQGRKIGKLKYGMCRIRVKNGGNFFKLIISMIDLLRTKIIPVTTINLPANLFKVEC